MLTAYDVASARLADRAVADLLLVGDSLGMVVLGRENTLAVTVDEIVHHARAVAAAHPRAVIVGDLPFLSYHVSIPEAIRNAGCLLSQGGCQAVKLEGGPLTLISRPATGCVSSAGLISHPFPSNPRTDEQQFHGPKPAVLPAGDIVCIHVERMSGRCSAFEMHILNESYFSLNHGDIDSLL